MHLSTPRKLFTAFCLSLLAALSLSATEAKHAFTLVIDAGHGGHDAGAVGAFSKEKNINLKVALAFGKLVEKNCPDVKVIYTRKTDIFIPLQRRADIANDAKADLFISVHTNALPGGRIAYGSETYSLGMARAAANLAVAKRENSVITLEDNYQRTYKGFDPNKAESYVIFEIMQDKYMKQSVDLARFIQKAYTRSGRPDKGVHQAGFLVLRNTSMPSVLTELGFITTPNEEQYLNSDEGQEQLSRSIFNGFLAYRRQYDKTAHDLPADLPVKKRSAQTEQPEKNDKEIAVVPVEATRTADTPAISPSAQAQPTPAPAQSATPAEKKGKKPKQQTTPATPATKKATPSAKKQTKTTPKKPRTTRVLYRIQLGAGKVEISPKDAQFKGLDVKRVKEGSLYKYFYGEYTTYAAARKGLQTAQAKIPAAYIVAYVDGKAASLKEARAAEKKK